MVAGGGGGSQIIGVMVESRRGVMVAGGGGGSQIIGVIEGVGVDVRVIAGGGAGSQIIGVMEGVTRGEVGGGGAGSQTIGEQAEVVAPPESAANRRSVLCRSRESLCHGIIVDSLLTAKNAKGATSPFPSLVRRGVGEVLCDLCGLCVLCS